VADGEKLKRERAGTYRTADGRFTVEQSSSGWLLLDAEQSDELGLPLARGPFGTLDDARAAIPAARSGPAPRSTIADDSPGSKGGSTPRPTLVPDRKRGGRAEPRDESGDGSIEEQPEQDGKSAPKRARPAASRRAGPPGRAKPTVVIRELRGVDGEGLRALWGEAGFRSLGDDDLSLGRMARRNPGLLLVATEGTRVIGSALGAWDGRRGAIYHLAVATDHRRQGIASRLVDQVEAGLRDLGCPEVRVHVPDDNDAARSFWRARRYEARSRLYARSLREA
jgi:N-acetylglutamate synthase